MHKNKSNFQYLCLYSFCIHTFEFILFILFYFLFVFHLAMVCCWCAHAIKAINYCKFASHNNLIKMLKSLNKTPFYTYRDYE